jgi:hypothetical protein
MTNFVFLIHFHPHFYEVYCLSSCCIQLSPVCFCSNMAAAASERTIVAHSMLRPTVRTTVVKTSTLGHVLHEPVKCAVVRQGATDANLASSSLTSGYKLDHHATNKRLLASEQSKVNAAATSLPVGTVIPMPCLGSNHVTSSSARTWSKHSELTDGQPISMVFKPGAADTLNMFCGANDVSIKINRDTVETSTVYDNKEVAMPAMINRGGDLDKLESEVCILKDQLEVQFKVILILSFFHQLTVIIII